VNGEVEKSAFPPHPSAIMSKTTIKMSTKTAQLTTFLPSKTSHFQLQTPEELLGRAGLTFRQVLAALTTAPTKRLGFAATAVALPTVKMLIWSYLIAIRPMT
jgi:hypothetical protein